MQYPVVFDHLCVGLYTSVQKGIFYFQLDLVMDCTDGIEFMIRSPIPVLGCLASGNFSMNRPLVDAFMLKVDRWPRGAFL